jgi:23S rRNA (cytosine1962-C5)-methyltransferase
MERLKSEVKRRFLVSSESVRLFHGRGHCFPGLEDVLIDWFEPVVLITLYKKRDRLWLSELVDFLRTVLKGLKGVILQERFLKFSPSRILFGELPEEVDAIENGLKYRLLMNKAQNVGYFPDMALVRSVVRDQAPGKNVLNLFAYSCSFSVAAIAGNARQVVNLDMNRNALALGKLNHQINHLDLRKASFLRLELFRSFSRLKKLAPFDLIICDPPAEQGRSFCAEKHWSKLVTKLPALIQPGGELMACLSSPHLSPNDLQELFSNYCPQAQLLRTIRAGENFPEISSDKGLNVLHYQFD